MTAARFCTTPLKLVGWSFESRPRRTLAKLQSVRGDVTYIDVQHLVSEPEYLLRLLPADQAKAMAMLDGGPGG